MTWRWPTFQRWTRTRQALTRRSLKCWLPPLTRAPSPATFIRRRTKALRRAQRACAGLDKKDSADEALAKPTSPAKPTFSVRSQNQAWFQVQSARNKGGFFRHRSGFAWLSLHRTFSGWICLSLLEGSRCIFTSPHLVFRKSFSARPDEIQILGKIKPLCLLPGISTYEPSSKTAIANLILSLYLLQHPSSPQPSPGPALAACHALKRLVAVEGAGESDGAEPKRSRSKAHEARRLAWELRTAEEARARLKEEGAEAAWKLKQELATRTKLEMRFSELTQLEEGRERPLVAALREETVALRRELGEERVAANGVLKKQVSVRG